MRRTNVTDGDAQHRWIVPLSSELSTLFTPRVTLIAGSGIRANAVVEDLPCGIVVEGGRADEGDRRDQVWCPPSRRRAEPDACGFAIGVA